MSAPRAAIAVLLALLVIAPTAAAAPSTCAVVVAELPAQPVIARRLEVRATELEGALTTAFLGLVMFASEANLDVVGPPLARYRKRGERVVVEAGLPVRAPPRALRAGLKVLTLPAGPAAVADHAGRLDALPKVTRCVRRWVAAHDRVAAGPAWERYLTNPMTTPDPAQQRAQVVVPLRR
ncbi:MAG: GyrI-like domain-containing protein [Kofleriaceae bacterium]